MKKRMLSHCAGIRTAVHLCRTGAGGGRRRHSRAARKNHRLPDLLRRGCRRPHLLKRHDHAFYCEKRRAERAGNRLYGCFPAKRAANAVKDGGKLYAYNSATHLYDIESPVYYANVSAALAGLGYDPTDFAGYDLIESIRSCDRSAMLSLDCISLSYILTTFSQFADASDEALLKS